MGDARTGSRIQEIALALGQEEYRALFDNSMDAILLTVPDGSILAANPAACAMFGRSEEEIVRLGRAGLVDLTDPRLQELLDQRARDGVACGALFFLRNDGSRFPVEVSSVIFKTKEGQARTSMIIRDITDRLRMENEIRALNANLESKVAARTAELEDANKDLEALASSLSYDLKAPLRAIDGYARMLLEDQGELLGSEGRRRLAVIQENALKMESFVTAVVALLAVGRRALVFSRVDMHAMAVAMFHEVTSPEEVEKIDFEISDIPDTMGDAFLLRKVWGNLLRNAVKFSRSKTPRRIRISTREDGEETRYEVSDNGIGFDQTYEDKLFKLFGHLHGTEETDGPGAGLAIVRRIVERHRGHIGAEGRIGEGATFWFSLPQRSSMNVGQ